MVTSHVPGLTDPSLASGGVDEGVKGIGEWLWGEMFLSSTGGSFTASGQEDTLYIDNEPLGCFEPVSLYVDLDNMQGGDTTNLRVYHRLNDAGGLQLWSYSTWTGADGGLANGLKVVKVDLGPCRHGFHATLEQSAGVMRAYDWELFMRV